MEIGDNYRPLSHHRRTMNLTSLFFHTLETTLPVFAMVFIGLGLRRAGWIDAAFINTASALVFKATLPTLELGRASCRERV